MKSSLLMLLALGSSAVVGSEAFAPEAADTFGRAFSATNSRLFNTPEPLVTEGEWAAYLDEETTGVVYYFNSRSGESRWEPPTDTFPSVYLKPSLRRKAEEKKAVYYKSMQQKEGKKNFVTRLLDGKKEEERLKVEEEPEWMKSILEEKYAPEEEKQGFFSRLLKPPPQVTNDAASPVPVPVPVAEKESVKVEEPKKNFFDSIFESMTADAVPKKPDPFFADSMESEEEKAARIAEEERIAAEDEAAEAKIEAAKKKQAEAAEAESKAKADQERKKAELEKKKAEEEVKMMERVKKAEAEQKAEADRLEAEARKVIEAEAKRAKQAAAEAKKAEQAAKRAVVAEEPIIVEERQEPMKIDIGSCVLPHPSKVLWGGEDAVFAKGRTFGVFDGVSGADKIDGLPLYSKMLARQMTQLVGTGNDLSTKDLQDQLLTAAEIADERATGASTAIMASITEDGFLRAINLGDSVCIVVRGDKVVAKTKEIIHYFDCPYQLSDISPDRPRDARKLNFELLRGDVVLMGSDGIFDNLEEFELVEIVNSSPAKANTIAKRVSDRSRKVSLNSRAATPYSKQAKRNGDPDFRDGLGGKVDDIGCVVALYD